MSLPEEVAEKVFDAWEASAWKWPPEISIDGWAEQHVRLPSGVSAMPGPLSFAMTPFMREPLAAIDDKETEEVVLCTSTQISKTTILMLVMFYYLKNNPWNMIWVMPSEKEALELKGERVVPIIKASPVLRSLLDKDGKGQVSGRTLRVNGVTVTFAGAHSPSGLASKPNRICCADEIDKWPRWSGSEASPLDLLGERLKTFADAKFIKASTPTTEDGQIVKELQASTNERYFVPCPHCGHHQVLIFGGPGSAGGIKWPKEADADDIEVDRLAWYQCEECKERIDESHKRAMVTAGVWAPEGCAVSDDGKVIGEPKRQSRRKRGFHIWSAYSLWARVSWSHIAAKFLRSKGRAETLMNFTNSWLGETFSVVTSEMKKEHLESQCQDYWPGSVLPDGAFAVTFGIDVQERAGLIYHYYVVRAWGKRGESWLLRYGQTNGWAQLNAVISADYRLADGQPATKIRPMIDSGFRTGEVYEWCHQHGSVAYKGDSRSTQRHFSEKDVPVAPNSEDEVTLTIVNPSYYKTELHRSIREDRFHLPQKDALDAAYFDQLLSEQVYREPDANGRMRQLWRPKSEGIANHYLDCEVMSLVVADMAELLHMGDEDERAAKATPQAPTPEPPPTPYGGETVSPDQTIADQFGQSPGVY